MSRFGKNLPRQGRGRPIKAADLNAVRSVAEGLSRGVLGGARLQTSVGGVPLSLPAGVVFRAKVLAPGVTGWDGTDMGEGSVQLHHRRGTALDAGATVPVVSFVALDADDWCYVAVVEGGLEVISAVC